MKCNEGPKRDHPRRRHGKKRRMRQMAKWRRMMEMMAEEFGPMAGGRGPNPGPGPRGRRGERGPGPRGGQGPRGRRHGGQRPGQPGNGTQFHGRMKKEEAISMLEDLVEGLKSGTLEIENNEEHVSLKPARKMEVHVRTHQTQNAEVIGLRLKWRRKDGNQAANFRISSGDSESEE